MRGTVTIRKAILQLGWTLRAVLSALSAVVLSALRLSPAADLGQSQGPGNSIRQVLLTANYGEPSVKAEHFMEAVRSITALAVRQVTSAALQENATPIR